jgi:hypothetical protein
LLDQKFEWRCRDLVGRGWHFFMPGHRQILRPMSNPGGAHPARYTHCCICACPSSACCGFGSLLWGSINLICTYPLPVVQHRPPQHTQCHGQPNAAGPHARPWGHAHAQKASQARQDTHWRIPNTPTRTCKREAYRPRKKALASTRRPNAPPFRPFIPHPNPPLFPWPCTYPLPFVQHRPPAH